MKFKDWFMQEQQTLRELGDDFVEDDPRLAPVLGRTASDPASEYLMEHFAFLTARLAMKIEDHLPELTHPLLQLLYPNFLRPLPSMTLMQFQPVDHALSETQVLPKGTPVFSRAVDGVSCEFRTCVDLAIAPLEIRSITTQPSAEAPVVRIDLGALSEQPLRQMKCDQLRFHLAGSKRNALTLYQWLARPGPGRQRPHHSLCFRTRDLCAGGTGGVQPCRRVVAPAGVCVPVCETKATTSGSAFWLSPTRTLTFQAEPNLQYLIFLLTQTPQWMTFQINLSQNKNQTHHWKQNWFKGSSSHVDLARYSHFMKAVFLILPAMRTLSEFMRF